MTPLVKAMLRSKSRVSDEARLKELNKRISEVISENRKQYNMGVIGSKQWWKGVDLVSQRRNAARVTLDRESLDQLNEYFGNLCSDTNYIRPVDIHIDPDVKAPTIPLGLVWNTLSNLKKTRTRGTTNPGYLLCVESFPVNSFLA